MAVGACSFRVAMARIALHLRIGPSHGLYEIRITGAVAMTVNIVTFFDVVAGKNAVGRLVSVANFPSGCDLDIDCVIDVLGPVLDVPRTVDSGIVAVIAGVLSDPLGPHQAAMAVGFHGQAGGAISFRATPGAKYR